MMGALFARAALAACLLSFGGIVSADTPVGYGGGGGGSAGADDETVSPDLLRIPVRLCAQVDNLQYTSDNNECPDVAFNSPGDSAAVCEQARQALADAMADTGHAKNRVAVLRKIVAKTCGDS